MAKLLLLDVYEECMLDQVKEIEIEELEDYYKYLKCDAFDIATRKVGDKYYDIFVDDCGLFVEHPKVSAVDEDTYEPMLVGNLILANHDSEGNTTSLSDDDFENIKKHILLAHMSDGSGRWTLVCKY